MNTPYQNNDAVNLLQQLWSKFKIQPIQYQLFTLLLILITSIFLAAFYSSFIIWQLFSFVMTKVLLRSVGWYLGKS